MNDPPGADSQAILLLCTYLGRSGTSSASQPYDLSGWNLLAERLWRQGERRPGDLLGMSRTQLSDTLAVDTDQAERIFALLARSALLAIELERLSSLGIWVVTRADPGYPPALRLKLRRSAPPVLFGCGDLALLGQSGIAVVGSRNADPASLDFAARLGHLCAAQGFIVISGGARGVDSQAMQTALAVEGRAVGVLAESLEKSIRRPFNRAALSAAKLVLLSPYGPDTPFSNGTAMGRNKLIYGLAEYAVVVCSDFQRGGTWAGALEDVTHGWTPLFLHEPGIKREGLDSLVSQGAKVLPHLLSMEQSLAGSLVAHVDHTNPG